MFNLVKIKNSWQQTLYGFKNMTPILIGTLLLISLFLKVGIIDLFKRAFSLIPLVDGFIGSTLGSLAVGNPITSYIVGSELLNSGVGLIATAAFIVSWVTVGIVQLPAESFLLGRRFAIIRNTLSFIAAILVAILTAYTLKFLG